MIQGDETIHASCIDELTAALGADRVQTGDDIRRLHGTDSSFHPPALPDAVVFPETVDECLEIVRTCIRHETPMVPFGAGSSLEGHIMALRGGVSIDMSRMNAITRISVEDLDVTVQAGSRAVSSTPGCAPRACSSPSTPAPTRRSAA